MDLDHIRREFADFRGWLYFNAARQGPLPERSRRAAERAVAAFSRPAEFDDDERFSGDARVRTGFARLTGAHPSEIAIGTGTGFGLGLAATCLPQPGDEVLIGPSEYLTLPTSFVTAAKQHEFSVRRMSPAVPFFSVEDVEAALTPRTRVVALSAVSYDRGYRADLEAIGELCRRRDLYFVVDACQAAGSVPLDVSRLNVDVLATGAYKWLLSPYGTGLAYFSERARAHMVSPTPSNHSVEAYEWPQLELAEEARGLDVPQAPTPMLMWPLAESLELILEVTVERVHQHAIDLADRLLEQLPKGAEPRSCLDPGRRSAIFAFDLPSVETAARVRRGLMAERIHLTHRERHLRFSPHLYNSEADVDRLGAALRELLRGA